MALVVEESFVIFSSRQHVRVRRELGRPPAIPKTKAPFSRLCFFRAFLAPFPPLASSCSFSLA